jgi:hypothetical protein
MLTITSLTHLPPPQPETLTDNDEDNAGHAAGNGVAAAKKGTNTIDTTKEINHNEKGSREKGFPYPLSGSNPQATFD